MAGARNRFGGGHSLGAGDVVAGRYEVESVLGEGATGPLYKVKSPAGEALALRLTIVKKREAIDALRGTIALHAQLSHVGLCRLRDCGDHAGRVFYAMDYLEGQSIDQLVYRLGPMTPDEAVRLVGDAANIVTGIHDAGYVHQDIKQGNLFLLGGDVRLLEFGVIAALAANANVPAAKLSTPSTRAPGQTGGLSTDPRMDVYALGAVLYYAVVGRRAFPTGRQFLALAERLGVAPPPLQDVPSTLRPILQRALAMRPEDRFQSARELATELAKVRAVA